MVSLSALPSLLWLLPRDPARDFLADCSGSRPGYRQIYRPAAVLSFFPVVGVALRIDCCA
jgi:hypothetical protein